MTREAEKSRQTIKESNGKGYTIGLMKVLVRNNDSWIELIEKEEIENTIHQENQEKFSQTQNILAISELLVLELDFLGEIETCRNILQGTFEIPNDKDQFSTECIKALTKPAIIRNPPKVIIATEGFRVGWKKMKEATLEGISGMHFRYIKACTHSIPLSNLEVTIRHILYATRYSPQDQQISINTIVEKKGKGNQVGDLRIINLIEVDFKFNNKVLARDLLRCTEENDLLLKE